MVDAVVKGALPGAPSSSNAGPAMSADGLAAAFKALILGRLFYEASMGGRRRKRKKEEEFKKRRKKERKRRIKRGEQEKEKRVPDPDKRGSDETKGLRPRSHTQPRSPPPLPSPPPPPPTCKRCVGVVNCQQGG